MEALRADSHDPQINREPIAGAHLPDKMEVVFEIHGPRFASAVVGVAEPHGRIEGVSGVIEHNHKIPDVHMIVSVCPLGPRDRLVAGRSQFRNLF